MPDAPSLKLQEEILKVLKSRDEKKTKESREKIATEHSAINATKMV